MVEIDARLRDDCVGVGRLALCHVLLMDDARFPWLVLVPDRAGVSELFQLEDADLQQLARESAWTARALAGEFRAHKMNVAALGNVVAQLHVHHVVRYRADPAWPGPVWGVPGRTRYGRDACADMLSRMRRTLAPRLVAEG